MPTSATGTSATERRTARGPLSAAPAHGGFTLIELLVVVVIIGVVSAGMILSVNLTGRDSELEKESQRLTDLFSYAREQAELQTRDYGVMFRDDGYEFLTFDTHEGLWRTVDEDDALGNRALPAGLDFKLTVETRPVVLKNPKQAKEAKDKTPQVTIFSNGDLTAFAATIERDAGVRSIIVTEDDQGDVVAKPMVEVGKK
jgi:general secretion pathway protein H